MSQITLDTPVEVVPAQQAITTNKVTVLEIRESYGWDYDPNSREPGSRRLGPGRPQSVEAVILLENSNRNIQKTITVWEGAAYLAVRGTWTDADLTARLTQILTGA
jgi:hypothetical protein